MKNLKLYLNEIKNFFTMPLGQQIKYYFLFYFVIWLIHLVLISGISYFHLLLNHNIGTISDWIQDRGWTLILITKLFIAYLIFHLVRLKTDKYEHLKKMFRNTTQPPRREMIVFYLFLIIGTMAIGNFSYNSTMIFEVTRLLLSMIGTFAFFAVDFVFLSMMEVFFPIRLERDKNFRLFIFSFLYYLFSSITFVYEQTISFKLFFIFFILLYVGEWRRRNWTLPFALLALYIVPLYSFMGLDPVWGRTYSFFYLKNSLSTSSLMLLFAVGATYLHLTQKKNPEYIYRD